MMTIVVRLFLAAILICSGSKVGASVVTPARSLRALAGRQVWTPICSRRGVNGSAAWFDNTNTAVMDQVACVSPAYGTVTAVKLVYAAFDMPQQGETDRPVVASGTAAVLVPQANSFQVIANGAVQSGSSTLTFAATTLGANGISVGQMVSSTGGGIAAGTYVTAVSNSFSAGSGNVPLSTTATLSSPTTATTAAGQPMSFAGSIAPVKFGGKRQFLLEPAHDVVTSDPVSVLLAPTTSFYIRSFATMSVAGMQLMDYPGAGSRLPGEFDNRSTSPIDQTLSPATLSNTGGGYWCPVAVLGLVTVPVGQPAAGSVLILGDSIAAGTGDNADALGLQGYIQRSLENNIGFITAARGSTTAFAVAAHGDGQFALSVDTGITDVLLEDGRNDVSSFAVTDIQLETNIKQVATRYGQAGKRVWCFTIPPTTQSNDGWSTLVNQSWTVAVALTGSASTNAGSTAISMASVINLSAGQTVSGPGVAPGTVISSINGANLLISAPLLLSIAAATKLSFGSSVPPPAETYRLAYNSYLRQHGAILGCNGVVDDDGVFADAGGSGKWRADLGSASLDGVHPSPALHQAAVNAALITPSMFLAP